MEDAARWQYERIQQLEDKSDDLAEKLRLAEKMKATTKQSAATKSWAEMLFAAVGPDLSEPVFRALTKFLHPDVLGVGTLQQQLNDARDRVRR